MVNTAEDVASLLPDNDEDFHWTLAVPTDPGYYFCKRRQGHTTLPEINLCHVDHRAQVTMSSVFGYSMTDPSVLVYYTKKVEAPNE